MTTTTTTNPPAEYFEQMRIKNAAENAKILDRWIKRFDKWMTLCDNLSDARETHGKNSPQFATAFAAWEKGLKRMPSKNSKYAAYAAGRSLAQFLNKQGHDIRESHKSVDELRLTLDFYTFTTARSEVK